MYPATNRISRIVASTSGMLPRFVVVVRLRFGLAARALHADVGSILTADPNGEPSGDSAVD
jgi:hypothetical protein